MEFISKEYEISYKAMCKRIQELPKCDLSLCACSHCKQVEGRPAEGKYSDLECWNCGADMKWLDKTDVASITKGEYEYRNSPTD